MVRNTYLRALLTGSSLALVALCVGTSAHAALNELDDQTLSQVEGQATGVQISLSAAINQVTPGVSNCGSGAGNTPLVNCRLGLQLNNVANWLLFKGFNGYINIPQITLYGVNLTASPISSTVQQSAIALNVVFPTSSNANNTAIQFKNLSYTMGLQLNTCYTDGLGNCPTTGVQAPTAAENQSTYYASTVYQNTNAAAAYYSSNAYDLGKETGVIGVNINGNLNVGGTLYVFSK